MLVCMAVLHGQLAERVCVGRLAVPHPFSNICFMPAVWVGQCDKTLFIPITLLFLSLQLFFSSLQHPPKGSRFHLVSLCRAHSQLNSEFWAVYSMWSELFVFYKSKQIRCEHSHKPLNNNRDFEFIKTAINWTFFLLTEIPDFCFTS